MSTAPAPAPRDALHALCLADPVWAERYQGWTELGHGASATVVRTFSRAAGEEIALKIFQRLDEDDRRRFQQEVRHSQRLASPCVVRTHSPFLRGSLSWIEMEWVDGPDLRQELQRRERDGRPFTLAEAQALGAALAQALVVAHESGVIHRDVKPANVLLPRTGFPPAKLSDFGISRVAGAARVTATGLLAGTPQFAAPEVIAGQPADARSDVYSFALVLYLILSGNRFPFAVSDPESPGQWLKAHAEAQPRALLELRPDAPEALAALLARALAKDPSARPGAHEFLALLEPGPRPASTPAAASPAGRRRVALLAGGLLLAALGALLFKPPVAAPPAPTPTTTAPAAAVPEPPAPNLEATLSGDVLTLVSRQEAPLVGLELVLTGRDGSAYRAQAGASLGPREELVLALDSFAPVPPRGFEPARLEATCELGAGRAPLPVALR